MVNDLGFTKNAAILNEIVSQATGRKMIAPINREQFIAVGQLALKVGYDPILNSISSMMGRTVFSVRPYDIKFKGLRKNTQQFGDQTRKLSMLDGEWEENTEYDLKDGESVDMYKIKKEHVLQTNFYGFQTYSKTMMIWRNQLNVAFSGPEEFNRFMGMKMQNIYDQIKQGNEEFGRQAVANLIGGVVYTAGLATNKIRPERCVPLVAYYNSYSGSNLTYGDVVKPSNIIEFAKFFYAYMASLIGQLSERTVLFHQNPKESTAPLLRHTPMNRLKCYMYEPFMTLLDTAVHSEVFHNEYLKYIDYEPVSHWQTVQNSVISGGTDSIFTNQRTEIAGSVGILDSDGTVKKAELNAAAPENGISPIIGVLFDEEACGYTVFDEHVNRTPWNAAGDYAKVFFKYTNRYWNDFTENAVVLTLW